MSQIEQFTPSNDRRYDDQFHTLAVSICAKEAIAASGLSAFDVQTMYMDDELAFKNGESYERWIELYWGPRPPIEVTEISTEIAMRTFADTIAVVEVSAQPQQISHAAAAAITQQTIEPLHRLVPS